MAAEVKATCPQGARSAAGEWSLSQRPHLAVRKAEALKGLSQAQQLAGRESGFELKAACPESHAWLSVTFLSEN